MIFVPFYRRPWDTSCTWHDRYMFYKMTISSVRYQGGTNRKTSEGDRIVHLIPRYLILFVQSLGYPREQAGVLVRFIGCVRLEGRTSGMNYVDRYWLQSDGSLEKRSNAGCVTNVLGLQTLNQRRDHDEITCKIGYHILIT